MIVNLVTQNRRPFNEVIILKLWVVISCVRLLWWSHFKELDWALTWTNLRWSLWSWDGGWCWEMRDKNLITFLFYPQIEPLKNSMVNLEEKYLFYAATSSYRVSHKEWSSLFSLWFQNFNPRPFNSLNGLLGQIHAKLDSLLDDWNHKCPYNQSNLISITRTSRCRV